MMGKKQNHYQEIISLLQKIHKEYPTYTIGQHLATATNYEYDLWSLTDKDLLLLLERYEETLELDSKIDNEFYEEDI